MAEQERDVALVRAIAQAGGPVALADRLGVTPQAVSQWRRCPPRRVHAVVEAVRALGGSITSRELRPDIYPGGNAA